MGRASQFLQTLIDALPVPIFYKDEKGVYLGCNARFEEFLRMPRGDFIGKSVFEIAPPELAAVYHAKDQELLDNPGVQIYESSVENTDGQIHQVLFHKSTFYNEQGELGGLVGAILDITQFKVMEQELRTLAAQDPLTGLLNRRAFEQRLESELQRARRYARPITLMFVDIDHFKRINDTHGHPVGDKVLCHATKRILESVRGIDVVARYGGEEFVVLMPETPVAHAEAVARRLCANFADLPIVLDGPLSLSLTVSIGLADSSQASDVESLVSKADEQLYAAKRDGRNCVRQVGAST